MVCFQLTRGDTLYLQEKKTGILCDKNMNVLVRKADFKKNSKTVSWMGGRNDLFSANG
jgi:ATP-dependent Lhr-like helicase